MPKWIEGPITKPKDFNSRDPHDRKRELTFENDPLTSTCASWHMCIMAHVHIHSQNILNNIFNIIYK